MGTAAAIGGGVALGTAGGMLGGLGASAQADAQAEAAAINAGSQASQLNLQSQTALVNAKIQELNYDAQAEAYLRQANNFGLQGRQERELIGLTLGQSKGDIIASAAGSGISVDSKVVDKTLNDTVKSAYRDMEVSARNEYENTYGAMQNAKIARINADNSLAIGKWASNAYSSLADQTLANGAILSSNIQDAGYTSAMYSMAGGAVSGLGMGIGWAL